MGTGVSNMVNPLTTSIVLVTETSDKDLGEGKKFYNIDARSPLLKSAPRISEQMMNIQGPIF
jgi:hypothetical protein